MRFLHLSDIHFLRNYPKSESGYNSIFSNMTSPLIQIERCLKKVDLEKIDFVIITGDLVEAGNKDDYKELKEALDKLLKEIPCIVTLGNHDNKQAFYEGWLSEQAKDEPYNVVKDIGGLRIIAFDNSVYKNANGHILDSQYTWLRDELNKAANKDTILIHHHHLLKEQFTTPSIELENIFEKMIKESSIIGIFSGHTHHYYEGLFADKPYYTAGSLSFIGYDESCGIVRFEECATCNICTYKNGEIYVDKIDALTERKLLGYVNFG